ncbi:MAG: hypothetical protein A2X86_10355 [Bdellovibrionales bacterium GWA2_49_15]|nr:MAG: hypothetical protein A2X86_10355 [Bdellovibrionales bacterium GWA2_49_15]
MSDEILIQILHLLQRVHEPTLGLNNVNAAMVRTEKIDLGTAMRFSDTSTASGNRIDFPFKSLRVIDASDLDATLNIRFNYPQDKGDSMAIKKGDLKNLLIPVMNGRIECSAQSGKWMKIEFSMMDQLTGQLKLDSSGLVMIDGVSFAQSLSNVATASTGTLIIAASGDRGVVYGKNIDEVNSFWIGSLTEIAAANWDVLCEEILPGGSFTWKNTAGLYARSKVALVAKCKIFNHSRS